MKNKKLLAVLIFAAGLAIGILAAPYLKKSFIGADLTGPDVMNPVCVAYEEEDYLPENPPGPWYECFRYDVGADYGYNCFSRGVSAMGEPYPYPNPDGSPAPGACLGIPGGVVYWDTTEP